MRNILNIKTAFLLLSLSIFTISCKKVNEGQPTGDVGNVFVKVIGGGTPAQLVKRAIDFVNTPSTVSLNIQRLVAKKSDLDKKMTIKVLDDTALVNFFNKDTVSTNPNATNPTKLFLEHLPATWYTVGANTTKIGGRGGVYTIEMNPSEFIKDLNIIIPDATLMNPSTTYALGFTITSVDADGKISIMKSGIMTVGAKNNYDGVYSYVSGLVTRYSAPGAPLGDALSGPLGPDNPDVFLITTGANTVNIPPAGSAGQITWSGGTSGVAGIDGLKLTVDPVTNFVTVTSAANLTLANWSGKRNQYDPATKTFFLGFKWNPNTNVREYEVVFKYKRSR